MFNFGFKTKKFANIIASSNFGAYAMIKGSFEYSSVRGRTEFYDVLGGTIVVTELFGLPSGGGKCPDAVFGYHIHEGGSCKSEATDPFSAVGGHYNPENCQHPAHVGDMPVLFGNNGYAWSAFFTNRFKIKDIVGRTVIVHSGPDDFKTQPSGDSGEKIACGEIKSR